MTTAPPSEREFHLSDVLSITTGRLVSTRHIEGVYDILNFMTGDSLFTRQLPRARKECELALFEQHPQLRDIDASMVNEKNWKDWLAQQVERFGEKLTVRPLASGKHVHRDPIKELEGMVGKENVLVVEVAESTPDN